MWTFTVYKLQLLGKGKWALTQCIGAVNPYIYRLGSGYLNPLAKRRLRSTELFRVRQSPKTILNATGFHRYLRQLPNGLALDSHGDDVVFDNVGQSFNDLV